MKQPSFKQYLNLLQEGKGYCDSIKDPVIRKACKNLTKKSYKLRMHGGGFGLNISGAGADGGDGGSPGGGE